MFALCVGSQETPCFEDFCRKLTFVAMFLMLVGEHVQQVADEQSPD